MRYLLLLLLSLNVFAGTSVIPDKDSNGQLVQTISPFASKGSLKFRGTGFSKACTQGVTTDIDFTVPTGIYLLNGIEVLNGAYGDVVQLQVVDTAAGTYSTVPNMVLDQFGINWNMRPELIKEMPYDATLYTGMIVRIKYTNNGTASRTIYVNLDLHHQTP